MLAHNEQTTSSLLRTRAQREHTQTHTHTHTHTHNKVKKKTHLFSTAHHNAQEKGKENRDLIGFMHGNKPTKKKSL